MCSKLSNVGRASSISCLDKASKTVHAATMQGEAAQGLVGCLWAKGPGVAGGLAASSRPRPPYSGLSLVPAATSGLAPSSGVGRLLWVSVRVGP